MSSSAPPAPPTIEQNDEEPWDLSRLVASAAPEARPEPLWESLPSARRSHPLGEIERPADDRGQRRRFRGLQVAAAFSVGALIALFVSTERGHTPIASAATLDVERGPERVVAPAAASVPEVPVAMEAAPSTRVAAPSEEPSRTSTRRRRVRAAAPAAATAPTDPAAADEIAPAEAPEAIPEAVTNPVREPVTIDTESASMDELLDHAVAHVEPLELPTHGETQAEAPAPVVERAPAPIGPSRDEVQRVMEELRPALAACASGAHGLTQIQMSITPSGRARAIRVHGAFAGSPEGSCMAHAARGVRFDGHDGDDDVTVRYPYRF